MTRFFTMFFSGLVVFGTFFGAVLAIPFILGKFTLGEFIFAYGTLAILGSLTVVGLADYKDPVFADIQIGLKNDFRDFFINTPYESIGSWRQNISREEWLDLQRQYREASI